MEKSEATTSVWDAKRKNQQHTLMIAERIKKNNKAKKVENMSCRAVKFLLEDCIDPAHQQMETEHDAEGTAGATNAGAVDAPLSVEEANDEVAQMIKAKAAKTKKRCNQNSPGKPKETTKKIIRQNISNQFK